MSSVPLLVLGERKAGVQRPAPKPYNPPPRMGGRVSAHRGQLTPDPFGANDYPDNVYVLRTRAPAPSRPHVDFAPPLAAEPTENVVRYPFSDEVEPSIGRANWLNKRSAVAGA
ncbi:MAG: hypothetical protein AAF658_00165, partial [Myxococcota bacterium]